MTATATVDVATVPGVSRCSVARSRSSPLLQRRATQRGHAWRLYATQSTSTLQSTTMRDSTQARAGGCSPK